MCRQLFQSKIKLPSRAGALIFMLVRQTKFAMLCEIDCIAPPVFFELSASAGKNQN
jgi:hypothetical protein